MGQIFQRNRLRPDGSEYFDRIWSMRFYDPLSGFTRTESTGETSKRKAEQKLRERESAIDHGERIKPAKVKKTMMVELLEMLRDDYKRNGRKDLYSLEKCLDKKLIPFFRYHRAAAVDYEAIQKYISKRLSDGVKGSTINRELSHLSKSFTLGSHAGLISSKPVIPTFKENNRRKGFFEEIEFRKVLSYLPDYVKPIAVLAYFTGMRLGELLSLKWEQVNVITCCVRLEETKNGDPREIHYGENPELKTVIDSQWERKLEVETKTKKKIEHLFFKFSNAKPIQDFRVAWNNACEKAEIKGKRIFHDLRRTAVRNFVRAGVPESIAQLISGHETRSVFERYNIRDPQQTRSALGKVSRNFESQIEYQNADTDPQVKQTNNLDNLSTEKVQ